MKSKLPGLAIAILVVLVTGPSHVGYAQAKKQILINVKVEAEGGTKGQGMWTQNAQDLSQKDLEDLDALITGQFAKQPDVKLVPEDYPDDIIGITVVAEKVPGRTGVCYIASSAIVVSKKGGTDELLTHDVFASNDLGFLARNVSVQFAVARLRASLGPAQ
jgi:hypothetical protein